MLGFLSIIVSLIAIGIVLYCLFKVKLIENSLVKETNANKARIGRLIQELNVLHEEKKKMDDLQNMELGI